MNPDTAPIAEVEAWLVGKQYPFPACLTERVGPTIDAALACLPNGWYWIALSKEWMATKRDGTWVDCDRSHDPANARDELLRLAAKAWMVQEDSK